MVKVLRNCVVRCIMTPQGAAAILLLPCSCIVLTNLCVPLEELQPVIWKIHTIAASSIFYLTTCFFNGIKAHRLVFTWDLLSLLKCAEKETNYLCFKFSFFSLEKQSLNFYTDIWHRYSFSKHCGIYVCKFLAHHYLSCTVCFHTAVFTCIALQWRCGTLTHSKLLGIGNPWSKTPTHVARLQCIPSLLHLAKGCWEF